MAPAAPGTRESLHTALRRPAQRDRQQKSQKTVAVVTITTPARLTQLLDRWMIGDSQLGPLRSDGFGVMSPGAPCSAPASSP